MISSVFIHIYEPRGARAGEREAFASRINRITRRRERESGAGRGRGRRAPRAPNEPPRNLSLLYTRARLH